MCNETNKDDLAIKNYKQVSNIENTVRHLTVVKYDTKSESIAYY